MRLITLLGIVMVLPPVMLGLGGCGDHRQSEGTASAPADEPSAAIAVIAPIAGFTGAGTVKFNEEAQGLHVVADVTGFHPGKHGIHIHEYGDLSAVDLSGLGSHFNPTGQEHGAPGDHPHHAGDLGNLIIGDDGQGHLDEVVPGLSLSGPTSVIGRSVVIHENEDDLTSQPAGNSGKRIAAAVIGIAKP